MAKPTDTRRLDAAVDNLKKRGVALPRNHARAQMAAATMHQMASSGMEARHRDLTGPAASEHVRQLEEQNRLIREMGANRTLRRRASMGGSTGSDLYAAIPRFYDPLEYFDLSGLPWNVADEGHRHKLHKWMRLYYSTHYLVPILIDIFTRFPLVGMELDCKDTDLKRFYEELFLDQLNYGEFMVGLGREYWTVGEAFPLGSFDEDLGIWEREELLNPEDIVIENFPLLGSKQLKIVPPEYLKKLAQTKQPPKEYQMLKINFPELIPYLKKNEHIPISSVLLKHIAFTANPWDDHGTPLLLRGLRTLIHEEKLLASQDAIAERLYSPLILAKLGVMDLGDGQGPWIPSPEELDAFRDDVDMALANDFRLLVHHFGIEMENVFGREQMPRLGDDFDRIERRIMQIFGVNPSLLSAGSNSQPYASSALQAEFLNQILRTFQGYLKRHFHDRAMVVAEAQGHYDYEKKGTKRLKVYEQVVEYDEEGNKRIVEKPKLLVPDLDFATLDLRDEATQRQFLQSLRAQGVPIPDQNLMIGVDIDIKDMVEIYNEELVSKTIAQQEAKMKAYKALKNAGLPIPPDLKAEVESVLGGPAGSPGQIPEGMGSPFAGPPGAGGAPPAGPAGGPGEGIVMPGPPGSMMGPTGMGTGGPGATTPPIAPNGQGIGNGFAPPASFERRPGMPRPASTQAEDESLKIAAESDKVNDEAPEEAEEQDRVVIALPKASHTKKYSFVEELKETSESTDESSGSVSEGNRSEGSSGLDEG